MRHVPVLLKETIAGLNLSAGDTVLDATLGDGGHSEEILKAIGPTGKLIGIDTDPEAILRVKQWLHDYEKQLILVRDNFVNLNQILGTNQIKSVDAILLDLGWSTPQFSERGRGFSFVKDEPLDMRYAGQSSGELNQVTAAEILNTYPVAELIKIFKQFGEDKFAKPIALAIADARRTKPVEKTSDLNQIILNVYRQELKTDKELPWVGGHHPATQTYQALRIAVNRELEVVRQALPQALAALAPGGRLAVITFHSVEDRIVKQFFKSQENKTLKLVNKKPIIASDQELTENASSRSAKLRIVERT